MNHPLAMFGVDRVLRLSMLFGLAIGVSACGGGGSSGSLATNAAASGTSGAASGTTASGGVVTQVNGSALADQLFGIDLASVGDTMLGRSGTGGEFSTGSLAPAGNSYTQKCDVSGDYSVVRTRASVSGNSVGDMATVVMNQCKSAVDGVTITENGKVTVKLTLVSGGYIVAADTRAMGFDMTFENLAIDHASAASTGKTTLNGTWSGAVEEDVVNVKLTLNASTFSIATTKNGKSFQTTLRNLQQLFKLSKTTQAYELDADFSADIQGSSDASLNGSFTVVTDPVFAGIADDFGYLDDSPTRGEMTVTGSRGGRMTLEAQNNGTVRVTIDENGDGLPEKDTVLNWVEIAE